MLRYNAIRRPVQVSLLLFAGVLFLSAQDTRKYEIKSGIITFEVSVTLLGKAYLKKEIVYFDDYGRKECRESYDGTRLEEAFLNDGGATYTVVFDDSTAYKSDRAIIGTEMAFDWQKVPEADRGSGKARKLPAMIVGGKPCDAYEHDQHGAKATYAGWKRVTLYAEVIGNELRSTTRAVEIREPAIIPASKFSIPAGFTIK